MLHTVKECNQIHKPLVQKAPCAFPKVTHIYRSMALKEDPIPKFASLRGYVFLAFNYFQMISCVFAVQQKVTGNVTFHCYCDLRHFILKHVTMFFLLAVKTFNFQCARQLCSNMRTNLEPFVPRMVTT